MAEQPGRIVCQTHTDRHAPHRCRIVQALARPMLATLCADDAPWVGPIAPLQLIANFVTEKVDP
jgi:hypothetical protein